MKTRYLKLQGKQHIYCYECSGCKTLFPEKPIYFPTGKLCKYCPECGHEFKELEIEDKNVKR